MSKKVPQVCIFFYSSAVSAYCFFPAVTFYHEETKMFPHLAGSSALLQTLSLGHPLPLLLYYYISMTEQSAKGDG